jgi:dGTPase
VAGDTREERLHSGFDPENNRNAFQRDRDRVMYSGYFRRLSGVSQVASAVDGDHFHNRLSHTLEVSQIARRLAERLSGLISETGLTVIRPEPEVAEAAAFAHDLGHPPFGHVGETAIRKFVEGVAKVADGFEGNAQSFRIVNRLTRRDNDNGGLDLTRLTLASILKYPWKADDLRAGDGEKRKYGAYDAEVDHLKFALGAIQAGAHRTIEAEVMDWADDIAYSVHDVYDFYRARMIPLERLKSDHREWRPVIDRIEGDRDHLSEAAKDLSENFLWLVPDRQFDGGADHRARMRRLSTNLITRFIVDASDVVAPDRNEGAFLKVEPQAELQVKLLKELVWYFVIEDKSLAAQQKGQTACINCVLHAVWDDIGGKRILLPISFREQLDDGHPAHRVLADFVSGLTERQALALYRRLTGLQEGSIMDVITI